MQITINEEEIMEAIRDYCARQISLPSASKFNIELVAGRSPAGTRAIIDIVPNATQSGSPTKVIVKDEAPDKTPDKVVEEPANEKPVAPPEIAQEAALIEAPWGADQDSGEAEPPGEGPAEDLTGKQPGAAGVTLVEGKSLFDL